MLREKLLVLEAICRGYIMIAAIFTSVALASVGALAHDSSTPGRAIFWTPGGGEKLHEPVYQTQSTTVSQLSEFLSQKSAEKELLVLFCSDDQQSDSIYTHSSIASSIKNSEDATVFPFVYHTLESVAHSVCVDVFDADAAKDVTSVTLSEMTTILSTKSNELLNNGVLESYLVQIPAADVDMVSEVVNMVGDSTKSLLVTLQNPSSTAPTKRGNYHRMLSSDIEDGLNYLPEGTEFTIYSQGTYLYLTPDLFTGLMTMLFMFFVLLTGYNCLGAIQGPSTFASTLPALGKEG